MIYRLNAIPNKIQASNCVDIDKLILKAMCRGKRPRIANIILKENKVRGLMLPIMSYRHQGSVVKVLMKEQTHSSTEYNSV